MPHEVQQEHTFMVHILFCGKNSHSVSRAVYVREMLEHQTLKRTKSDTHIHAHPITYSNIPLYTLKSEHKHTTKFETN